MPKKLIDYVKRGGVVGRTFRGRTRGRGVENEYSVADVYQSTYGTYLVINDSKGNWEEGFLTHLQDREVRKR